MAAGWLQTLRLSLALLAPASQLQLRRLGSFQGFTQPQTHPAPISSKAAGSVDTPRNEVSLSASLAYLAWLGQPTGNCGQPKEGVGFAH